MDFGFKIKETDKKLDLIFKKRIESWDRLASELIKNKVILDIENAKKLVENKGDFAVYKVFSFKGFSEKTRKILEINNFQSDITLLRHGIFSLSGRGELFLTHGHLHEKAFGEAYTVLKNECIFELSDKNTHETFIIFLKEGNSIFIHPKFLHRIISYKKDCVTVDFVPKLAGHNYEIIKNKGFPFHIFYDLRKEEIEIIKNDKYKNQKYKLIKKIKTINPIKLFEKDPERLKDILENPSKYREIYLHGHLIDKDMDIKK